MLPKTPKTSKRLFVGIPVSEEIQEKIIPLLQELQPLGAELKPVHSKNLHITLHFFGEVEENRISEIEQALKEVVPKAFSVEVKGVGFFPNPEKVKVIWIGCPSPELQDLLECIKQTFSVAKETPHITLARVKKCSPAVQKFIKRHQYLDLGKMLVNRLVLYESTLAPQGAAYTALKTFPFP